MNIDEILEVIDERMPLFASAPPSYYIGFLQGVADVLKLDTKAIKELYKNANGHLFIYCMMTHLKRI